MTQNLIRIIACGVFGMSMLLVSGQADAGRPLTVDDANTNEKGAGHLESWWARVSNGGDRSTCAKGEKSTVQVGVRGEIVKSLQLDGTIGRTDEETVFSVGIKL